MATVTLALRLFNAQGATLTLPDVDALDGLEDFSLTSEHAAHVLDLWRDSAPFRGYTTELTGDHDWDWIMASPTGHGSTQLLFSIWSADHARHRPVRDRWLLSDFPVAVVICSAVESTGGQPLPSAPGSQQRAKSRPLSRCPSRDPRTLH